MAREERASSVEPAYTPEGFIVYAECYGRSAFRTASAGGLPHNAPIGTLALHCVELSLKAVMVRRGARKQELLDAGHDLHKLFEATGVKWKELDINPLEVTFYRDALISNTLRYRDANLAYVIEPSFILPFTEKVFHHCLEVVIPGANRTLRN